MPARRLLLFVAVAVPFLLPAVAGAQSQPSMESQVFAKINAARSKKLIFHSGVHTVAWHHSADMASSGGLNHANADARISNAPPDPPEANGAPDDGYGQDWCENVTYVNFGTEAEAAGRIYWDGSTWWATFIAYLDHTPPGVPAPAAPVAPKQKPAVTQPPTVAAPKQATTAPAPEGSPASTDESSNTGSVEATKPAESAVPSTEPNRILVITEPSDEDSPDADAATESIAESLFAAVRSPELEAPEISGAVGALLLGLAVMLLRLKLRAWVPRKTKRTSQKYASTPGSPMPDLGSRELAGDARHRQRELVGS